MKKIYIAILVSLTVALNGYSYTQINFQTALADGIGGQPANDALLNHSSNPLAANSLFLVYFSEDSTRGFNNVNPYSPLGGDEYMGSYSTGVYPGEIAGNTSVTLGTLGTLGYAGYVYVAVFEISYSSGPAPAIPGGSYYGLGNTMATTDFEQYFQDNGLVPTPSNYGTSRLEPSTGPVVTSLTTVVPEPSTVGLLLVGAGIVMVRRFRRG
ncbi:MAG: PEP-CTERM sorting domain-containing protein [Leptolinea sp.]